MEVKLYTTAGCHLCEAALALLHAAQRGGYPLHVCEVEIAESECLIDQYGIRIPVVACGQPARELGWPFSYEDLIQFLTSSQVS